LEKSGHATFNPATTLFGWVQTTTASTNSLIQRLQYALAITALNSVRLLSVGKACLSKQRKQSNLDSDVPVDVLPPFVWRM
jgi:hypothetical protein